MHEIRAFVDEKRQSLLQKHERNESRESLSETLSFVIDSDHQVGLGLLHMGDIITAQGWFAELSPAWIANADPKWEFTIELSFARQRRRRP